MPTQKAHDVWSLGCTVYEMLTGGPPWQNCTIANLLLKISNDKGRPKYPKMISYELKDFLDQCFCLKSSDRPTISDLLKHNFILSYQNDNITFSARSSICKSSSATHTSSQ